MEKGTRAVALEKGGLRFVRPLNTANSCFGFFVIVEEGLPKGELKWLPWRVEEEDGQSAARECLFLPSIRCFCTRNTSQHNYAWPRGERESLPRLSTLLAVLPEIAAISSTVKRET